MFGRKPRRRRNGFMEILNGMLSLLVLALVVAGGSLFYIARTFYADSETTQEMTFQVPRGTGLAVVAQRLEDAGIIGNQWIFQAGARAREKQGNIKAGEFNIASGASMADVLMELTEGNPIIHAVTIPEGFTSWQVVQRMNASTDLSGDIVELPAEGSLLPNTYTYERGDDRLVILQQMITAQNEALAEIWDARQADLPLESPAELVALASIVEKETGVAEERPMVAAVFINRLNFNMRLQSDPTIIYGITNGEGPLGRGLKRSEIEAETPYNTYVIKGLPVGPIANPGLAAMQAVANPADTDALYFVADGTGGHAFAASYAEHRRNVAKWRAIEKERAVAVEAEAEAARDAIEAEQAAEAGEN